MRANVKEMEANLKEIEHMFAGVEQVQIERERDGQSEIESARASYHQARQGIVLARERIVNGVVESVHRLLRDLNRACAMHVVLPLPTSGWYISCQPCAVQQFNHLTFAPSRPAACMPHLILHTLVHLVTKST
jgi:hypothetical protein